MENDWEWNKEKVITELTQGRELVKQLPNHLNPSSHERHDLLVEKILFSYEKVLTMLKWCTFVGTPQPRTSRMDSPSSLGGSGTRRKMLPQLMEKGRVRSETRIEGNLLGEPGATAGMSDSTPSHVGSSVRSEVSDRDCTDQYHKDDSEKRNTLPQSTEIVRVPSETWPEGHPDNGFSWRKCGQKMIGGKIPRAYYRCSNPNVQGTCKARKQVQISEEDASILEITYQGIHTCSQASHLATASVLQGNEWPKQNKEHNQQQQQTSLEVETAQASQLIPGPKQNKEHNQQQANEQRGLEVQTAQASQLILALASQEKEWPKQNKEHNQLEQQQANQQTGLEVQTEDVYIGEHMLSSSSFPSTQIGSQNGQHVITDQNSFGNVQEAFPQEFWDHLNS